MSKTSISSHDSPVNVTRMVTYARKAKVFEARLDGRKVCEHSTREGCEALLVRSISPDLGGMVKFLYREFGNADLTRRAHRASKLVLAGAVSVREFGYIVDSETVIDEQYTVERDDYGIWGCSCDDHLYAVAAESYGAPAVEGLSAGCCKHVIASIMVQSQIDEQLRHSELLEAVA